MIEHDKIRQKLQFMRDRLRLLEHVQGMSIDDFENQPFVLDGSLRSLQVLIESMLDIGSHIVAREGFGIPQTYSHVIELLAEHGVITKEKATTYASMVKFRNRIVHMYDDVDAKVVYQLIKNNLDDFRDFMSAIVDRYFS